MNKTFICLKILQYNDIEDTSVETLPVLLQVAQLHHELNLKDELLQFYTNAAEGSEDESSSSPTLASFSLS